MTCPPADWTYSRSAGEQLTGRGEQLIGQGRAAHMAGRGELLTVDGKATQGEL